MVRKVRKQFSLPLPVVEELEERDNQSQVVTELLQDAGYGDE